MDRRSSLAVARLGFGLLTFVAIAAQLTSIANTGHLDVVNYFSYFTILSNIIGATLLLVGAALWRAERNAKLDLLRGAAVVYLSVTFIVFALLLSNTDVDLAIPWVNSVLHEIIPIVIVVDWLIDPPIGRLSLRQGLVWLTFPAVWIVYVLIRGGIVGKYPYPFLDPANGGYASVAVYCLGILVLMTAICAITVWLGNVAGDRRRSSVSRS
jgi:uncharacterized membrane protein YidH (DUF202 family)